MAISEEKLSVEVVLDSSGAIKGIRDLQGNFVSLDKVVENSSKQFNQFEDNIRKAGVSAKKTDSVFVSFKNSLQSAAMPLLAINQAIGIVQQAFSLVDRTLGEVVRSFIELESVTAKINTLLSESEKATFDFAEAIRDQQKAFGTSTAEAGKAFYEAIASGAVNAAGAIELMSSAQKLAIGGVTTLDTSVNVLTSVLNSYGLAASEAGKISDVLFIAAAGGKTDIEQLSKQLGDVLGIARAAGVSFSELASAVSAVTAAGQPTAIAVTAVRAAISELLTPTKELRAALKNIGITNVETAIKTDGFVNVIRKLSDEYGTNATALAGLFARLESLPALTALVSNKVGSQFDAMAQSSANAMLGLADTTENAFAQIEDTSAFRMKKAQGEIASELSKIGAQFVEAFAPSATIIAEATIEIVTLARKIGSVLVPVLGFLTRAALQIVNVLGDAAQAFNFLIDTAAAGVRQFSVFVGLSKELDQTIKSVSATIEETQNLNPININQEGIRESIAALEELTKSTKKLQIEQRLIGKSAIERAQIEKSIRIEQIDALQNQLQEMGLFGKANQKSLEVSRQAVEAYYKALGEKEAQEQFKKSQEEIEKNLKKQKEILESVTKAFSSFSDVIVKLSTSLQILSKDREALNFTTGESSLRASEKEYQQTLLQIEAEQQKAIAAGLSLKSADELAIKALALAQSIKEQSEAYEIQKDILKDFLAIQAKAKENQDAIQQSIEQGNEVLLRLGLDRVQLVQREFELEQRKLDLMKKQISDSRALTSADQQQFDLAQRTLEARREAASAQATKEQGSSNLGATVGSGLGDALGQVFPQLIQNFAGEMGAVFAQLANVIGMALKAPELIKGIASFVDSVTNFPIALLDAVVSLTQSLGNFVNKWVENIASAIPKIIDSVITALVDFLPQIPGVLLEGQLQAIASLISKAPEIASALVERLVLEGPKMAVGIIRALIVGIPKIVVSLGKALPKIIPAILAGLRDAILGLGDAFADMFTTGINDGLKASMKGFTSLGTGVASQLFSVADIAAEAGAEKKAEELGDSIRQAAKDAVTIFDQIWNSLKRVWSQYIFPFFDALIIQPLMSVWNIAKIIFDLLIASFRGMFAVSAAIWTGVIGLFRALWDGVKVMFHGIINALVLAWQGVKDLLSALWEAAKTIFNVPIAAFQAIWKFASTVFDNPIAAFKTLWSDLRNIGTNLFNSLANVGKVIWNSLKAQLDNAGGVFSSIGSKIGTAISSGISGVISSLGNAFANLNLGDAARRIGEEMARPFQSVFDVFKPLMNSFIDVLNSLRLPKVDVGGEVFGRRFGFTLIPDMDLIPGNIPRFAQGGQVGGSGFGDIVPAMLTPGEFVVSRPAVNSIGTNALESINRGRLPQGATNISLNLTLNASERIDANYVRDKLMPAIKDELRKESRRGGYIIAASGVRA